jgi:hypothetical protein
MSVWISVKNHRALKRIAKSKGLTMSTFLRRLCEREVKRNEATE